MPAMADVWGQGSKQHDSSNKLALFQSKIVALQPTLETRVISFGEHRDSFFISLPSPVPSYRITESSLVSIRAKDFNLSAEEDPEVEGFLKVTTAGCRAETPQSVVSYLAWLYEYAELPEQPVETDGYWKGEINKTGVWVPHVGFVIPYAEEGLGGISEDLGARALDEGIALIPQVDIAGMRKEIYLAVAHVCLEERQTGGVLEYVDAFVQHMCWKPEENIYDISSRKY